MRAENMSGHVRVDNQGINCKDHDNETYVGDALLPNATVGHLEVF